MARVYALLSALMSLIYLLCIPAFLVLLFINWKTALFVIPVAFVAALMAKWLNGLKLKQVYGKELGGFRNEMDWESGRKLDP